MIYLYSMFLLCALTSAGNVLFLTPFGSHSHKNLFTPLAYALGEKGHIVTLVSIYKPKESSLKVNELVMTDLIPLHKDMVYWLCKEGNDGGTEEVHKGFTNTAINMCDVFYQNDVVLTWVKKQVKFDIVIVDGVMHDCLYPIANMIGKKIGALNTATLFPWIADAINSPYPLSYIPFFFYPFKARMNFWERMISVYNSIGYEYGLKSMYYPAMDEVVKKYYPKAITISEALKKLTLVLCNGDSLLGSIRPNVPVVADIGGIHCRPGQALDKEFKDYIDSSKDGFIIFSLGSIFNESLITVEKKQHIFNAFSLLKYKIIWKTKADLGPGVPSNVNVVKWIPQQDLLSHPKCIAFITHSGLLSIQEAVYHAVPMIVIPLFAEQPINAAQVEDLGIAVRLVWHDFKADDLVNAVKTVETLEFRNNVKKHSEIFKDISSGSLSNAVYWTEYVMRNEDSDFILKVDTNELNIIQYFLLDVIAFLLVTAFCISFLLYTCMKVVLKKKVS